MRTQTDISKNRHGGNPESENAFKKISPRLPERRKIVLSLIRNAGSKGLTTLEASELLKTTPNAISGRFSELKRDGLIEKIGTRKTPSGCSAAVYREVEKKTVTQDHLWPDMFNDVYSGNPYE